MEYKRRPTWLGVLGTLAFLAALVVILVSTVTGNGLMSPRGEPVLPDPSASASPWEWPVETSSPAAGLEPGEGSFPDPAAVDRTDPDAVAEAVARISASHDAALDSSELDALERAGELVDPALLGAERAERTTVGPVWLAAQEHEAYSSAEVTPVEILALSHSHEGETEAEHAEHADRMGAEAVSADGEEVLAYEFEVVYQWKGRDGWGSEPADAQVRGVQLSVAERGGEWVVVEHFYGEMSTIGY